MYRSIEPLTPLDKWLDHGSIYLLYHGFHHIHACFICITPNVLFWILSLGGSCIKGSGGMPFMKQKVPQCSLAILVEMYSYSIYTCESNIIIYIVKLII